MAKCETCGNEYDKTFEIRLDSEVHTFDCFECAIQALAPECSHCGTRIVGHGLEHEGKYYCCVHCADAAGVKGLKDRV